MRTTTNGQPPAKGHENASAPQPVGPTGQHGAYWVLSESERSGGFLRPVRDSYRHKVCQHVTQMGTALAQTFAKDPTYYNSTFCCFCGHHYDLKEFQWLNGEVVGT